MPLSTVAGLRRPMPQLRLYDAYGLSETHSPATILLDAEFERKPGSIGRPVPCCDVHIVDPDGSDLPTGEAGELLVRGPNITSGYVGDPAATATAIRNGWLLPRRRRGLRLPARPHQRRRDPGRLQGPLR